MVVMENDLEKKYKKISSEMQKFYLNMNWYCGYVILARDPFHSKCMDYYESPWSKFVVHGGVTFLERTKDGNGIIAGFDCNHNSDQKPDAPMKILDNVERECEDFAKQIMLWIYGRDEDKRFDAFCRRFEQWIKRS